jgi:hypothetical protein
MIVHAGTFHLVTIRVLEGPRFAEIDQRGRPWSGTCAETVLYCRRLSHDHAAVIDLAFKVRLGEIHRHLEAPGKTDMPAELLPPLEAVLIAWKP